LQFPLDQRRFVFHPLLIQEGSMIDLSKYRIVDLSHEMIPGEKKIDGRYLHGEPFFGRMVEVQEFVAYGARMHFIQSQTHNGTHCEGAYKYLDEGPDMAGMPLSAYIGEALVCDFSHKGPGEAISADEFRQAGVKSGDIVLVHTNPENSGELPYFNADVLDFFIETRVKLLASSGNLYYGPAAVPDAHIDAERRLLEEGIPMVDALKGLDQLTKDRVFFIALPLKMQRVTASWTRAIALEEID
jgi:kynurenine formamidase